MEINLKGFSLVKDNGEQREDFIKVLELLTKLCLDSESRATLPVRHFTELSTILEEFGESPGGARYDILAESFRFLRNSVAACPINQEILRNETTLFQSTCTILGWIVEESSEPEESVVCVRCGLQFLANSMTDNPSNCGVICSQLSDILEKLMEKFENDEKVVQYSAMIVHLAIKFAHHKLKNKASILTTLLDNLHLEFVIYAMESWVLHDTFIDDYNDLNPAERIKLLTFSNSRPDLLKELDQKVILTLKDDFIQRSDFILKSKIGDKDNLFCWEIAILLEFLCTVSSLEIPKVESDQVLLITTICLLKQIDAAGRGANETDNVFTPIEDLAKLTSKSTNQAEDEVDIRAHPTFQFKAHLIRLIANLTHRNKSSQDKVRELECLPIILDNCKIDARNPFIAQWSILAIRNLCEGNEDNQSYIREVQRVDTEKLLPDLHLVEVETTQK